MCEYTPDCTKQTDPVAKALSENPREDDAALLVLCPKKYHLLAAVYDLEPYGGLALCQPHMKARYGSTYVARAGMDPDRIAHWHPSITPLAELGSGRLYGRCRCGTWSFTAAQASEHLEHVRAGTWEGIDPYAFVKVRDDATGTVSRMARQYVERHLLPLGGHTIVGRAPGSERLRRPHMLSSWVEMADAPKRA